MQRREEGRVVKGRGVTKVRAVAAWPPLCGAGWWRRWRVATACVGAGDARSSRWLLVWWAVGAHGLRVHAVPPPRCVV